MISRFFIIPVIIAIGLSVTVLFMNFEEIAETKLAGVDADKDKISDRIDNCPKIKNEDQDDFDQDAVGDPCDLDDDNDGIVDVLDVFDDNPEEWSDFDFDGIGSKEDPDDDNDGVIDSMDEAPVPVSEELVATYLENIQECAIRDDGTSRLLCYSQFFGRVAEDQENNSNALELSIALSKIGLIDDCHFVSHEVGHVAFNENPSVIENLVGMDGTMCRGGYFHGVLAAYFHDVQEDGDPFPSDYDTVCNDLIGTSNYQDCVHGLGHGMVHYFEEDLESSLQMCHNMSFYQNRLCVKGVMMQYTDNVLTRQGISKDIMSELCKESKLDDIDFVECSMSAGTTLAFFTNHDYEEGSKSCNLIENKQGRDHCLEGLKLEIQDSEKYEVEPLTLDKREKFQPQFVEEDSKVIDIQSPAVISNFQFVPEAGLISFVIDRPQYVVMYIPNEFLSSKMIVTVNGQIPDELYTKGNMLGERVSMIRFVPDDSGLVMITPLS
ncbi:Thrombospondin type 3 repeat domain containing protein [Marine Group I thaumarchaeote SCGC AAA799-P11]|uniref:Thrombospondin type 3 repeat domain containing protein n=1 Tax=Marine Group I thaumarchaeote SCGC AAA799-P11 TaxID=1502295 RepID=A0A087RZR6_9ARCH|nr:Thrombospondin type 3 repeat domain containing protein [Marine Group I thaumarchaeote SCGC AAA799-P11]